MKVAEREPRSLRRPHGALNTHHVVPEGARHQRLSLLAEVEAVGTEVAAIGAAILWEKVGGYVSTLFTNFFFS